jgi:hypothetical protein
MTLELVLDKIPRMDHLLDVLGSVFRPCSAALCFMAIGHHDSSIHPVLAMAFGLVIGGVIHWDKAKRRLALAERSLGLGTPFVSMTEDGVSIITATLSLLLGVLGPIMAVLSWMLVRATYRWSSTFGEATIASARARAGLRR